MRQIGRILTLTAVTLLAASQLSAQMGRRWPSERKIVRDPKTGVDLVFLTSQQGICDNKVYQTHNQWSSDGNWLIMTSPQRVQNEALMVNEYTGDIVQVTEGGYTGMLNVSRKDMRLYISRPHVDKKQRKQLEKYNKEMAKIREQLRNAGPNVRFDNLPQPKAKKPVYGMEFLYIDLQRLFADSAAGTMKKSSEYETILGVTPAEWGGGDMSALDGAEKIAFFAVGNEYAASQANGMEMYKGFGTRGMGAGPSGLAYMDLETGECHYIRTLPFQVGHIQGNPWHPNEVIFCWETGGKSPNRMWAMNADGSDYRSIYKETSYDWITHEAVITEDEVCFAVLGHRAISEDQQPVDLTGDPLNPGQEPGWGYSGTREYPTGLGIVNLRTREFTMAGQIPFGSGFWHVGGSSDGNWVVGDDFDRNLYLIDRNTHELIHLTAGHKPTAANHPHPTFKPDNTEIEFQSAMIQEDNRSMNLVIVRLPQNLLDRYNK